MKRYFELGVYDKEKSDGTACLSPSRPLSAWHPWDSCTPSLRASASELFLTHSFTSSAERAKK